VSAERIARWLDELCAYPDRHVGGRGNRVAAELFQRTALEAGFNVRTAELPCVVWRRGPSLLRVAGEEQRLHTGPYSPPVCVTAPLSVAGTLGELEAGGHEGRVLLLHGALTTEQLMPKAFPFFNPEGHRRIVSAIEGSGAVAMLAATGRNPDLAGGAYPFPLVDDGDFPLPSAFLTDVDGSRLLEHAGEEVELVIDSGRAPGTAPQPVATKPGRGEGRVVFFAHLDSKEGAPGALDNGTGVAALLGLAGLLADYDGEHAVEIVPLNGEDYYAATGQLHWLRENEGRLGDIVLGLNVDGAGFRGERTAVSFYDVPEPAAGVVRRAMEAHGFAEGPQWPQGDHSILAVNGVPAVAVTSENVFFIVSTVAHTERDVPDLADPSAVLEVARFFADVVRGIG
jgi:aminopeptidase YwaD